MFETSIKRILESDDGLGRYFISLLRLTGARVMIAMDHLGGVSQLVAQSFKVFFTTRLAVGEFVRQLSFIGNKSFSIVALIALFTGLVMALQLSVGLGRFGLKLYVGQVVGLAIFRELGPVLTALMIAARVGSGIAAELGSMVVTEQVLAIEAMGANPVQKLVVPRILATMIAAPLLTVMADAIGVLGGMLITVKEAGITPHFYIDQIRSSLVMDDFTSGIAKAFFFGFFVSVISCYQGLKTEGGTEGVGNATTKAVVISAITIFVSDFFLTKLIIYF
jgi:phospholipid/cholesterol/gamma-HCH transport system permease protein